MIVAHCMSRGRKDEILPPSDAERFERCAYANVSVAATHASSARELPNVGAVSWVEECGHVPHLERYVTPSVFGVQLLSCPRPAELCEALLAFMRQVDSRASRTTTTTGGGGSLIE